MTNLISRADAIEALENLQTEQWIDSDIDYNNGLQSAIAEIRVLQSAEAEWIPCSERLPSDDGRYLVCMSFGYDNMEVLKWADGWNCFRCPDGKVSRESEIDGADILAWMPLPKPYREEGK